MRTPDRKHYKTYVQGLKTLQKVMAICQKNGIFYYAASVHGDISMIIEPNEAQLDAIFSIKSKSEENGLHWLYIDIEGTEVRLVI